MNKTIQLRVILLEDNKSILTLLKECFSDRGYEIFAFSDPSICPLQLIPECRCTENQTCTDVIVSDLNMPVIVANSRANKATMASKRIRRNASRTKTQNDASMNANNNTELIFSAMNATNAVG